MKRNRLLTILSVLLIAAFMVTPVLAADPDADPNPGSGSADVTVLNTENSASSVTAEYYNQSGTLATAKTQPLTPLGSYQFLASGSGLADNWKGSMVVSSTTDVASVATIHWSNNPVGDGIEADSYSGFSSGSTRMNLPFVVYAPNAQYTMFSVQNTETTAASITMKYYNRDGGLDFTKTDTIPVNGQATYDMHTPGAKVPVWAEAPFYTSKGYWGGAVVIETASSTQKVAVVANNFWPAYSVAYNASSAGARKLFVPSVERRLLNGGAAAGDQLGFSVITVQNLGSGPTDLTFTFISGKTQTVDATIPVLNVAPGAAIACNTRIGAPQCDPTLVASLGDTWVGSVVIESSSQDVSAISFTMRVRDGEGVSTTAVYASNGGVSTFLPEVYRVGSGSAWTVWSLLRLQNVGSSDANGVQVRFLNRDGSEVVAARQTVDISAGKSKNYNLRYESPFEPLGSNWSGSVQIISPQPLSAVVENLWDVKQMAAYNGYSK